MATLAVPLDTAPWRPRYNPWLIALTVTLATFMEVLDTSIANIALPHIAGSFGASANESTWVLTSYLVSNGIVLPISAWLATRYGRKRFYMSCVALFTISSFLCGLAPSLGLLVFFRVLQGAGGGGLQPSEQAILADTFPPSQRGMAFSIYGMAVVVAPAIGPTLGGWITDNYSWRWIFYLNVPISLISLYLTHRLVEDPPYLKAEKERRRGIRIDYVGLGLISLAVGSLQMVLDKGQELDWFSSHWIVAGTCAAVVVFIFWIYWEWRQQNPIVELKLLRNRNLAAAVFFMFILGFVLYGTTVLIPQFLQLLMGYPAIAAGEALAGGGLVMMLTMPISGALVSRVDPRALMSFGFAATATALYYMATHLTLGVDFGTVALLRIYQTAGLAFIFIPSNVLAYVNIPRQSSNQVSSMVNFVRNIGGSVGIALVSAYITRTTQVRQYYLSSNLRDSNSKFRQTRDGIMTTLQGHGVGAAAALHQAYARVDLLVQRQAAMLAYKDAVSALAILVLFLVPLTFLMKRPPRSSAAAPSMH
jgi:MFS transporter, DHA2 family, multidrug resistance protein